MFIIIQISDFKFLTNIARAYRCKRMSAGRALTYTFEKYACILCNISYRHAHSFSGPYNLDNVAP